MLRAFGTGGCSRSGWWIRENTENEKGFLVALKGRGLKGQSLKLIIVDGSPALLAGAPGESTPSGAFKDASPAT
jgi:hypothetical protein